MQCTECDNLRRMLSLAYDRVARQSELLSRTADRDQDGAIRRALEAEEAAHGLRILLHRCQAAAGMPDPAEACRTVIRIAGEALS